MKLQRILLRPWIGVLCIASTFGFVYYDDASYYVRNNINTFIQEKVNQEVQLELDRRDAAQKKTKKIEIKRLPTAVEVIKKSITSVVKVEVTYMGYNRFTGKPQEKRGGGSGFFISEEGHILTCAHLFPDNLMKIKKIKVSIYNKDNNGIEVEAELLASQPHNDIAILKLLDYEKKTPYLKIRNSETLQVGDRVYVIGNPFLRYNWTVTDGMVSGLHREVTVQGVTYRNMIQTNAGISPGNSGGPLLDTRGRVIGVAVLLNQHHSLFVSSEQCLEILKKYNIKLK